LNHVKIVQENDAMRIVVGIGLSLVVVIGVVPVVSAQAVRRIQPANAAIATAVWHGDTLYVSGQVPDPVKPAAAGAPAVYAPDTRTQSESVFRKIEGILKKQGLGMGDVVMMHVYLVGDPKMGGKMDFQGMMAAYTQFFGSAAQPNKPARSTVQVASLAAPGALVEIEVIAVRSK
jgi:enamine deaminase RidA (YjgF/YER057c/UK114 family)